jgi:hypothetical protein
MNSAFYLAVDMSGNIISCPNASSLDIALNGKSHNVDLLLILLMLN